MKNHLYYRPIKNIDNLEYAKIEDLKYLLRKETLDLDKEIDKKFPLESLGNLKSNLRVKGAKSLLENFAMVDAKKIDLKKSLESIEYIGFDEQNIILNFKDQFTNNQEDNLKATGVYDFTSQFLDQLFEINKYIKFCLKNGYRDTIRENLEYLIKEKKEIEKQYRLIEKNGHWYLRGFTSTNYNNYDNHIAIYLVLWAFHQYAVNGGDPYIFKKGYLSDSEIRLYFETEKSVTIEGFGELHFGALISNSEIRDKTFSFELNYRVSDFSKKHSFNALPPLKDSIFQIQHMAKVDTLKNRLEALNRIEHSHKNMVQFIEEIGKIKKLTEDSLYLLYKKIINATQQLSTTTRTNFKTLYDENFINNTMTIIEIFARTKEITADIDEKIKLERIYYELLHEITTR
ncbi:hypothetical protein [Bacillus paralicheniformis]|uniref:hypothetical protein n=1 Tax=Bacillus paralicheniformis TaxID=1648923 RepID=UPI0035F531D7